MSSSATWHIASSGLVTTMMIASGERSDDLLGDTRRRSRWFIASRSSRLMPGLRGETRGDDDDVGAGGLVVAVRPDHVRLVADHRAGLVQVERLALRQALDDVHEHHVGVVALCKPLCGGGADVAGADYSDLPSHRTTPFLSLHSSGQCLTGEYPTRLTDCQLDRDLTEARDRVRHASPQFIQGAGGGADQGAAPGARRVPGAGRAAGDSSAAPQASGTAAAGPPARPPAGSATPTRAAAPRAPPRPPAEGRQDPRRRGARPDQGEPRDHGP